MYFTKVLLYCVDLCKSLSVVRYIVLRLGCMSICNTRCLRRNVTRYARFLISDVGLNIRFQLKSARILTRNASHVHWS